MKLARFCKQMAAIVKLNMILLPTSSLSSLFTIKYMYSVNITFTIRQPSNLNMYKSNKYSSEVDRVFLLRIKYNLKVYADFDTRIV